MRITPLVGDKVWFKPRSLGWGWAPASWEGWATTVVFLVVTIGVPSRWALSDAVAIAWVVVATSVLTLLCVLKGTSPGGWRRAEEYARRTAAGRALPSVRTDDPTLSDALKRFRDANARRQR